MKKIAILQSNYIPWKGYFDIISYVDEFIFYDIVQFTKNDWRNRNQIKTPHGTLWLTIPVASSGNFGQTISETRIADKHWAIKHWKTLVQYYSRSPFFAEIAQWLQPLYLDRKYQLISDVNRTFIYAICSYLGITTKISDSKGFNLPEGQTERLVAICKQAGATEYVSGPAAKNYIDEKQFTNSAIEIRWFDYSGYREYPQLYGTFMHNVSILDLLFSCGKASVDFLLYTPK